MIPLSALTSPVTGITWGEYNASHANVMWLDATSGPAACVYKVTWQDLGSGLLTGTLSLLALLVLGLLALLVQKYKY